MVKEVSLEYISKIIDNPNEYDGECVYALDGDFYIACDNLTSDAWVEEFETKEEAISWLNREWEIDEKGLE